MSIILHSLNIPNSRDYNSGLKLFITISFLSPLDFYFHYDTSKKIALLVKRQIHSTVMNRPSKNLKHLY
jgi:hypothetical protein